MHIEWEANPGTSSTSRSQYYCIYNCRSIGDGPNECCHATVDGWMLSEDFEMGGWEVAARCKNGQESEGRTSSLPFIWAS